MHTISYKKYLVMPLCKSTAKKLPMNQALHVKDQTIANTYTSEPEIVD